MERSPWVIWWPQPSHINLGKGEHFPDMIRQRADDGGGVTRMLATLLTLTLEEEPKVPGSLGPGRAREKILRGPRERTQPC